MGNIASQLSYIANQTDHIEGKLERVTFCARALLGQLQRNGTTELVHEERAHDLIAQLIDALDK